tara:strand:+ start:234 stop:602 length:369 start_codon:yes stop_codon:yes gene_type:complete
MDIQTINNRMGDLTQELSKQFQAEFIRLAETEEGLLGLMHEIAENPDMYFPILGPRTVHLAVAYNEAVNSYMALDEIIHEEWEESMDEPEELKPLPPITQDVIAFPADPPVDPYSHPEGSSP